MPARALFTVVMEFEGTTSISQVNARHPNDALMLWAAGLAASNAYGLSRSSARRLQSAIIEDANRAVSANIGDDPVKIDGVKNVWCKSVAVEPKGLALFNIVKTARK